ncbi:metal ABC transporter solute-binding protein, Zn/Mn family [Mycolicibacterium iranicum]|uniref:ABC transporter substrate-binding protein n=1 Tax=Mycolicibacterium iranicum TaxID=912594 RepID=A0A178M2Y5_MYCIR|nr:zinc ABC transporter substrate-binding protein [Mycolicibacterium iranicum]OAN42409.1 ABC transporter substrate-binding protein [Mycolicibacterium iranicum]
MFAASMAVVLPLALSACGGGDQSAEGSSSSSSSSTQAQGECPTDPVKVVASVDQWGGIVSQLGGACADVTTILAGSSVDPHDYEPAPSDAAKFDGAQFVVINGGHYDEWASQLASSSAPSAPVISAVELTEGREGEAGHDHEGEAGHDHEGEDPAHAGEEAGHDHAGEGNPHVWYNPATVTAVAEAVTAELGKLAPDAAGYFEEQHTAFETTMKPYNDTLAALKAGAAGKRYVATESVFDDMAAAIGMQNVTPEGYQVSSSNETDPSPADLDAFLQLLAAKGADVLIYNTQTEGSVPEQIRSAAEAAGIPVVDVTETLPPGTTSFETWQVAQLDALAKALGVTA